MAAAWVSGLIFLVTFAAIVTDRIHRTIAAWVGAAAMVAAGLFEYLAILTAQRSGGDPWRLLMWLGGLTAVLSMFLDNVTTIVLMAPVTLVLAEMLRLNPAPLLMGQALLSNIGGTATLVGDPPNILIGSAAGFSFNDFLMVLLPIAVVAVTLSERAGWPITFRMWLRTGAIATIVSCAVGTLAFLVIFGLIKG